MFKVNGKNVSLSSNDTLDNLKGKIAAELSSLPPFIQLPTMPENGGSYTILPIFYLSNDTIQMGNSSLNFAAIEDIVGDSIDHQQLKNIYTVSKIQTTIDSFGGNEDMAKNVAIFDLELEFGSINENIWSNRTNTIQSFKNMIEKNVKSTRQFSKTVDTWDSVKPTFAFSSFVLNKINHETEIKNIQKQNELMVFDSIKLNNIVIGCFYQEMVKYNPEHKSLIDGYLNQDKMLTKKLRASDIIRIMVVNNQSRVKYKMINVFVKDSGITFSLETIINTDGSSRSSGSRSSGQVKDLIKNILIDMGQTEAYTDRRETEYYYGSYSASINIPLLIIKELVTNDPNVYNISYINESALINTRKANLNIFLKGTNIGVSLFERPDTVGTFIRLKKINGGGTSEEFKNRIDQNIATTNKILEYASHKAQSILKYYREYTSLQVEIQPLNEITEEKENVLKNQAPDIFLSNYTRLCSKPPIIVENEPESELIMKFPIYDESEPKLFKCPYPDYKYPGLRENTKLANKTIFPFVPCCYKRPQLNSKNFKMYYNQEVYTQRINSGEIGKTLKILSPKRIGALPDKIDKLLHYTTENKFYRYGVAISPSSCLNILSMVTYNNQSEKIIRSELAKRAELCKGELSTLSVAEIGKKIMDPTTYINPRLFKGALEDYFKISYILFSKDEDDFSVYPNRFLKFICPLKERVVFLIEHVENEHVELIVDEETLNYVNKQGKTPIFMFGKNDNQVKRVYRVFKERFKYALFDINNKGFTNLSISKDDTGNTFNIYPWEHISPNGKVLKDVEPITQYIDGYGQTRLVEFKMNNISFVGQFQPLPCLKKPNKSLEYFIKINEQLNQEQIDLLTTKNIWLKLYQTKLNILDGFVSPYDKFKFAKKLAEYILWAACHAYSLYFGQTSLSVDDWIRNETIIVDDYSYAKVQIKPMFNLSEFMVDGGGKVGGKVGGKFIFNSKQLQDKIRFNLSLISTINLRLYTTNIYHGFYQDVSNFNTVYPAQLALSKKEYFQRTRDPYMLNILTTKNVQYIRTNTLYFIKEIFGLYNGLLCLFMPSLEKLIEKANQLLWKVTPDETKINVVVFNQKNVEQYSIGQSEPAISIIILNINNEWFYGLILPELM